MIAADGVVIAADGSMSHFPARRGLTWDSHVRLACPAACWKPLSSCACKPATHCANSILKVEQDYACCYMRVTLCVAPTTNSHPGAFTCIAQPALHNDANSSPSKPLGISLGPLRGLCSLPHDTCNPQSEPTLLVGGCIALFAMCFTSVALSTAFVFR